MGKNRRVAIIGMGPMGRRHLLALRLVSNTELVAVVDSRREALAAADLNGTGLYTDAYTMLSEVRPDLVIVATNGPSHKSLVLAAMESGSRGVLCEKPMACSIEEAEEMILASRKYRCALAVNHGRRHIPAYRWLRDRLQSGEWGQLRSMRSSWAGIGLGCSATHMIDLWRFLGGEQLDTVYGWVDFARGTNPRGAEFHDPGGMIVVTSLSGTRYVHEQIEDGAGPGTFVIDTTGAEIRIDERTETISVLLRDLSVKPGPGRPPKYGAVLRPPEVPLTIDIVGLSAASLRELSQERELTCEAEHGLRSLEVIVGAYLSHDRGHSAICLPLTDDSNKAKWLPIT